MTSFKNRTFNLGGKKYKRINFEKKIGLHLCMIGSDGQINKISLGLSGLNRAFEYTNFKHNEMPRASMARLYTKNHLKDFPELAVAFDIAEKDSFEKISYVLVIYDKKHNPISHIVIYD